MASSGSNGSVAKELGCGIRYCAAGGIAWVRPGADGGGAVPHNASDAAVGGPRGGALLFAAFPTVEDSTNRFYAAQARRGAEWFFAMSRSMRSGSFSRAERLSYDP